VRGVARRQDGRIEGLVDGDLMKVSRPEAGRDCANG
jgi:hypothetical protein